MRVGEVAERAGVNVETLRYYERRGLLPAPHRDPSGHRRYDEDTVRLLRAIKEAQAVGFTLAEIGEYLRASRRSTSPSEVLRVRMAAKIDEIDGRIAGLRRMREELARVVGCACDSLDHCTCGAAYLARGGRDAAVPPSVLHVTNGESAANTLRRTALGGAVLSWQDVLHAGPLPAVPRPELLRRRAGYLSDCGWGGRRAILASLERRDRQLERAFADRVSVVLWFEHDLYDQLQLVDVLALASAAGVSPSAVVVDSFPGRPAFRGLGELTAEELETLWPERRALTDEALETAAAVWDAFCAPRPEALAARRRCRSSRWRSAACSRSSPLPVTGSRRRSGPRCAPWPREPPLPPPPSSLPRSSSTHRSSATPGSFARSRSSAAGAGDSSRPAPATSCLYRLRWATGGSSPGRPSA